MKKFKEINMLKKIILLVNVIILIVALGFYPILPMILNYPPDSINNEFQKSLLPYITYTAQYAIIALLGMLFVTIVLAIALRKVNWKKDFNKSSEEEIKIIRKVSINYPYLIYFFQVAIPLIIILVVLALFESTLLLVFKIGTIFFTFFILIAIVTLIFSKRLFQDVLVKTYNNQQYHCGLRVEIKKKIIIQIIPLLLISTLFTALMGYSKLVDEKGDLLFENYKNQLVTLVEKDIEINDTKTIKEKINFYNNEDNIFLLDSNLDVIYNETEFSDFFIKYLNEKSINNGGRVYEDYGVDVQAVIVPFKVDDAQYYIGVRYLVNSEETVLFMITSSIVLFIIGSIVLFYFSSDMSKDISTVSNSLNEISEGTDIDFDKKLPVTSNDEIGDLVIAFNKILDLEKKNMETMSRNQEILVEQERLSSLGQLIGGIAHNLKTPIMSISGALEGVEDLIKEYDESIDDSQVTKEDHHQIAGEMKEWISKIRPYLSYMTEVIDAVKGQAVSMNASTVGEFSAEELIARTQILMKNELKRRHCNLNLDLSISQKTQIKGEISAIVQVMDNLIINAMDAYGENGGNIDVRVGEDEDKVYIEVADLAGGIADSVKDKLFKEMITSKGKNGTGLGLYMCYSTIKGKFDGDMWFESKEGVGTTFHIILNKLKIS